MVMGLMSKSKSNFRFQDAQRARDFLKPGFVVQNTEDLLKACVSHGLLVGGWVCCEHSLEPLQHMVIQHTDFGENLLLIYHLGIGIGKPKVKCGN